MATLACAVVLVAWTPRPALAQQPGATPEPAKAHTSVPAQPASDPGKQESVFDRLWRFNRWYENASNPVVQRVLFSGRYQHDYAVVEADEGNTTEWNVRRMRLGGRATLFRTFTLHGEVDLNPQEADPVYVRLTDFYLEWSRNRRFAVTVGKQGVDFTMDGSTSSRDLIAIDRSNLANNLWFTEEYVPGVSVSGTTGPWTYVGGVFSSGARNREFGEFTGGLFTLGVVGYDFAETLGVEEALLAGNYVYQEPDQDNTFTRPFEHIVSVNFLLDAGAWGARADLSAGAGYGTQRDVWALMAMPFWNITRGLQAVGRYTYVESDGVNGVRLATYENRVVTGQGDRYQEAYLGANYYFYGHRLKLQTGVQFADMNDRAGDGGAYSGVGWTSGVRVGW
jgi:phosphate-selective porin OprO/OprP